MFYLIIFIKEIHDQTKVLIGSVLVYLVNWELCNLNSVIYIIHVNTTLRQRKLQGGKHELEIREMVFYGQVNTYSPLRLTELALSVDLMEN